MAEVSEVSSFVVEELEGDKRKLTLRGRGLPYRPFTLEGSQRHQNDYYPGSPIGTLQVFGAKEEPTTINGWWKDKYLGNLEGLSYADVDGVSLETAQALAKVVDDMRRKGSEVQVTWLSHVRNGIIDKFTQKWHDEHDLEWELAFDWTSQGERFSDTKFVDDTATDMWDVSTKMQDEIDDFTDAAEELGAGYLQLDQEIAAVGAKLQALTDEATDALTSVASAVMDPQNALRRLAGILDGLKLEADLGVSIIEDTADGVALGQAATDLGASASALTGWATGPVTSAATDVTGGTQSGQPSGFGGVLTRSSPTAPPFGATFGESLRKRANLREQAGAACKVRDAAAREQGKLLAKLSASSDRAFQAREDQDLRAVSQSFFGTSDEWRGIMVYNNLHGSRLRAGQVVFVPVQPPSALGSTPGGH